MVFKIKESKVFLEIHPNKKIMETLKILFLKEKRRKNSNVQLCDFLLYFKSLQI